MCMYRLHSHIDDSQNIPFDCFEDMQAYVTEHDISDSDMIMEEWIDDRMQPELSGWREVEL
jgi:hypothetical protein